MYSIFKSSCNTSKQIFKPFAVYGTFSPDAHRTPKVAEEMDKAEVEMTEFSTTPDEKPPAAELIVGSEMSAEQKKLERRLLLKADCVILPVCAVVWWVTYLVRLQIRKKQVVRTNM